MIAVAFEGGFAPHNLVRGGIDWKNVHKENRPCISLLLSGKGDWNILG